MTRIFRPTLSLSCALVLALTIACVRRGAERGDRTDSNIITAAQIQKNNFVNAYLAVESLHANWLQARGTDSFSAPSVVLVYLDNIRLGTTETLRNITLRQIGYIRHYNGIEATNRWGVGHGAGVIYVATLPTKPSPSPEGTPTHDVASVDESPVRRGPSVNDKGIEPASAAAFVLSTDGRSAPMFASEQDFAGVRRAVQSLATDIASVSGAAPSTSTNATPSGKDVVLIGTIGKSSIIDGLIARKKLDVREVAGKWESFVRQVVESPMPGVDRALVIAGSDKRGTIYGVYDLSAQIGVSPWYWWADVPTFKQSHITVPAERHTLGEPAVRYRGIFINDEAPAFSGWTREKFGGVNSQMYTKMFELILRMKGNYLWPAMWGNAFADDDSLNAKLADEYGIVMGTSHHEPLTRAQAEWRRYGKGAWNYEQNDSTLRQFWRDGIVRMGTRENIVTVGMRGDGDMPMTEGSNIALLERIVADQRKIIGDATRKPAAATPQLWALYKEVQDYYDKGMRVPDDITLLFADDNWGNIRRLPEAKDRARPGGFGVYYHFDYVGGPRNYKWLNTNPIARVWQQMNLAHEYGANRIWIVNVGDLKPMEFPIQFFLDYAWNPKAIDASQLSAYTARWAAQQFGDTHAKEIAALVTTYLNYSSRRKPEMLDPETYSLTSFREAETVVAEWTALRERAERMNAQMPAASRDAFYQLVLHPILANSNQHELYVTTGLNRLYATQGRASTNDLADRVRQLFDRDAEISAYYNTQLSGGKWSHMMDQTHIGYTYWQEPPRNVMPRVDIIHLPRAADMGVAVVEQNRPAPSAAGRGGQFGPPPGTPPGRGGPALPPIDAYAQQTRYIDVFNRGLTPFAFSARAGEPWVLVEPASGNITKESRLSVRVDWQKAPRGTFNVPIIITGPSGSTSEVRAIVNNAGGPPRDSLRGFVQSEGYVSMEAEHYSRAVGSSTVRWMRIPNYGRTLSGMTATPVTMSSQTPGGTSPQLVYDVLMRDSGSVKVHAYFSPTLNFSGRAAGMRYAISFDDEAPQIINIATDTTVQAWEKTVGDNIRTVISQHTLRKAGAHVLHFWLVDPGVVLQRLVIEGSALPASYLGPPESFFRAGVPQ